MITKLTEFKRILENKLSKDDNEFISKKIKKIMDEGYPQKQAVAMAYSYLKKSKKKNESVNESFENIVIPRDFFNCSKLFKCMGQLSLMILDNKLPEGIDIVIDEPGEDFIISRDDTYDTIYVANYPVIINDNEIFVGTSYNSKKQYPLICVVDDTEYEVFDDSGNFTSDFIDIFTNNDIVESISISNNLTSIEKLLIENPELLNSDISDEDFKYAGMTINSFDEDNIYYTDEDENELDIEWSDLELNDPNTYSDIESFFENEIVALDKAMDRSSDSGTY